MLPLARRTAPTHPIHTHPKPPTDLVRLSTCRRHAAEGLFVQTSDEGHFDGKGFRGKGAKRERVKPPEHLLPIAAAGRNYVVCLVRNRHSVSREAVLAEMNE